MPSGQVPASSNYSGSQFLLFVPSPVPDGSYTCRVPKQNRAAACLQGNNNTRAETSIVVNGVTASLLLLTAELTDMKRVYKGHTRASPGHIAMSISTNKTNDILFKRSGTTCDCLYAAGSKKEVSTGMVETVVWTPWEEFS